MLDDKRFILVENSLILDLLSDFTDAEEMKSFEKDFYDSVMAAQNLIEEARGNLVGKDYNVNLEILKIAMARQLFIFHLFYQRNAEILGFLFKPISYTRMSLEETKKYASNDSFVTDKYSLFGDSREINEKLKKSKWKV